MDITDSKEFNGARHYGILLTWNHSSGEVEQKKLYKRYNAWLDDLYVKLQAAGFDNLPDFPPKKIGFLMTE